MSKIIITTEEELEALIMRVLNEVLQPLLVNSNAGGIKAADEIMTIKQVSELPHLSVQTIYGKTSARKFHTLKRGRDSISSAKSFLNGLTRIKERRKMSS